MLFKLPFYFFYQMTQDTEWIFLGSGLYGHILWFLSLIITKMSCLPKIIRRITFEFTALYTSIFMILQLKYAFKSAKSIFKTTVNEGIRSLKAERMHFLFG